MSRPVVLSNGEMHVGVNCFGLVHDFYYPYVGYENHSAGKSLRHRVGVWIDGKISWLDDGNWKLSFQHPHSALIGHTVARNDDIGIVLEFDDAVDSDISAFMRNIHVVNHADAKREIRLFMHQAFAIGDSRSNTDTAQYIPDTHAILHYRGRRAFMIGGEVVGGGQFDQHTVGLFDIEGYEGSYRDADDGELSMSNVEHGRVDSVIRFTLDIDANSSTRVHYWIAAGTSVRQALFVFKRIRDDGVNERLHKTASHWYKWLRPARKAAERIEPQYRDAFLRSIMVMGSHIDNHGAVLASTDSTMLNYARDNYSYCWPRDAAYVLWPMMRIGYTDEIIRFFDFCRRVMHPSGYLMHKFRADGALGSSWHPYSQPDGTIAPPIQEDETAIVVFLFAQYYNLHKDNRLLAEYYESMIKPMADFMSYYIDNKTGLPKPSYEIWEQYFMISTYTTAVVYASLLAAAELAEVAHDSTSSVKWRSAADDIYHSAHSRLYNESRKCLYKGIRVNGDDRTTDDTIDMSSIYGAFMFGLFPVGSKELDSSFKTALATFAPPKKTPGLPRYEGDAYYRDDPNSKGNWWYVTTLWAAQYAIENDWVDDAKNTLDWVLKQMKTLGSLAEQVNPADGSDKSVVPLTWSHAELVATLLDLAAGDKRK